MLFQVYINQIMTSTTIKKIEFCLKKNCKSKYDKKQNCNIM